MTAFSLPTSSDPHKVPPARGGTVGVFGNLHIGGDWDWGLPVRAFPGRGSPIPSPVPFSVPPYVLETKHGRDDDAPQPRPGDQAQPRSERRWSLSRKGLDPSSPLPRRGARVAPNQCDAAAGAALAGAPGLVAHPAPHRPGGLAWWSTRPNNSPPNPWTGSRLWSPIRPGGERCAREGIDLTGEGPEPPTGNGGPVRPGRMAHDPCRGSGGRAPPARWVLSRGGLAGSLHRLGSWRVCRSQSWFHRAGAAAGSVTRHATERR